MYSILGKRNKESDEEFITSKDDTSKLNGCNISVKLNDRFMNDVENDEANERKRCTRRR